METPSRPEPTLLQIISTDYLAQNFFVMIFAGWVIYFIDRLFEGHWTTPLAIFAAILTPIGLLTFFWRYRLIVNTVANGIEVIGRITHIDTIHTGKRRADHILYYEYGFQGKTHQYRNRVKKNAYAQALRQGQQVALLAHERTPHIAFIKDIYLEPL